jgi:PAS domain S-box-containing protein
MDFPGYHSEKKELWRIPFLIGFATIIVLVVNAWGLAEGITTVLPHLFYVPIILCAYYYPRKGIVYAIALSVLYLGMVMVFSRSDEILPALARILVFVLIAGVVSFLTRRMRESEALFRGVAERSSDIIVLTDLAGRATYVSPSVRKILGYDPAELTRRSYEHFIHPDDHRLLQEVIPQSMAGRTEKEVTVRFRKKDGGFAVIEFFGTPIIQEGQVTGTQVIGRDSTDRMRVESELRDTSRRLGDIIDFFPDPTMAIDKDGNVVAWNKSMEELTEITPGSILGRGNYSYATWFYGTPRPMLIDLVLHGDLDAIDKKYPKNRRDGNTIRAGADTVRPDGTRIQFWVTATPLFDQNGETVGAIETLRDVTRQKKTARAMRESKDYLDAILNTISDPVFVKDRKHCFVVLNEGFCRFSGHTRENLLGKSDYDFFPKDEADIYWEKDEEVFRTRATNENEESLTDAGGNRHTIVTKKSLYRNEAGEEFIVGIIRDITERKRTETALHEALRKLNMLSSITRHDILNQVTALQAYLELSKTDVSDPELLGYLGKEEEIIGWIARQIEFTRYYQDVGVQAPEWKDFAMLIGIASRQLDLSGIMLENSVSGIEIFADPLIEKVFYNLMENSLRHGGSVTSAGFSAEEAGSSLILTYRDNGSGISEEDKKKLFRKGFGKHTGLGLFLSREILSITGITISENGIPGKGVRFEITVPNGAYRFIQP